MNMKKLGVAILGTGAIAKAHILGYGVYPDRCEVRALCDLYADKAKSMVKDLDLNADVYTDYKEMLKRDDIDIVSICLPPAVHAQSAIDSMNAGKHVLVEKPMAPSLEECDRMIEAAVRNKVLLSPVAQNRFKTPMMKVKHMLENGLAGRVLHATVNSLWWRGQNYYDIWWRGTWEKECGGSTTSHAVHQLDLMQWMLGMPTEVSAIITNVGHDNSECEDLTVAFFRYPGMVAQLTASIVNHDEVQELVFQTEKARLSIPWNLRASKAMENGFPERDLETEAALAAAYASLPELSVEGHPAQIGNLLDAIEGKGTLLIDGPQGRNTMELIMAIYKASVTRAPVTLPLAKDDVLYSRSGLISSMPRFHEKTRSIENFATSEITLGKDVGK
jgi:predicted dehydrogenase